MKHLPDFDDYGFETWVEEREHLTKDPFLTYKGDFYASKSWKSLRNKVLNRYGRECMKCGYLGRSMHVDHVVPRCIRPDLSLEISNLQVLCAPCNYEKGTSIIDYRSVK